MTTRVSSLHEAVVYSDNASFLHAFTQFMGPALNAGDAIVASVTRFRRDPLVQQLVASGIYLNDLIEQGRYISLDPAELLSTFMINGLPDRDRFLRIAGNLIATAQRAIDKEHNYVAICGECAPLLWSQGNAKAAIQLEQLWNELATLQKVHVLCAYPLANLQGGLGSNVLDKIRAEHSAVYYR